jgi:hypothetical protein
MARWTDKKPPGDITILFEHGMKTVFVAACRTHLELGIHFDLFDFVIHMILLMLKPHAKPQRRKDSKVSLWFKLEFLAAQRLCVNKKLKLIEFLSITII